jgi:hypothetical protein
MGTTEGESVMGHIEVYNVGGEGGWTDLDDIPITETLNCQLCNEPTEAWNIIANIVIKDGVVSVGQWQCRKCHAVNG